MLKYINKNQSGFTIVELLVVIVVIGVLAAITIVSYTGIAQRATAATLKSDLKNASTQLELDNASNGSYPESEAAANGGNGLPKSPGTIYQYVTTSNGYCISATSTVDSTTFHVSSGGGIIENGGCILGGWAQVATSSEYACAIAYDSKAYCWGTNGNGQLGNNTTVESLIPVAVYASGVLSDKTILAITAHDGYTCVIASDNLAYCWGANGSGQLGNNSTTDSLVPVAVNTTGVLSGKTMVAIAAGGGHTCAIASDNNAYCWGANPFGQLGNNSDSDSLVPVAVNTTGVLSGKTILSIKTGSNHTCAIASDNQAYCWGNNWAGQLGNNSTTESYVPVAVNTTGVLSGKTVVNIDVGDSFSCAIDSSSQSYCWGSNSNGQLGNNSIVESHVPVETTPIP